MKLKASLLAGLAVAIATPALAHHSFAMFDRTKAVNITGNVKEYEWTNPHVWIHIMAPDAQGAQREWSFEMQSVQQDAAAGWRPPDGRGASPSRAEGVRSAARRSTATRSSTA